MLKVGPATEAWLGSIKSTDPDDDRPFLLVGVRVAFAPIAMPAVRAARRAIADSFKVQADDLQEAGDAFSREMIRRGIRRWEGVGDLDGVALVVTPASIELALADPDFFEAADQVYVLPWSLRSAEKNGLPVSRNGTGEAGTAGKGTARSRARRKQTGGAKSAPTRSTRSRATKPKASGTS